MIRAGPRTKTGRPPKKVTDLKHELEVEASEGKLGDGGHGRAVLDRYLEHLAHKGHSPKTLDTYRRYVASTIRPAFGPRRSAS